ncbi:condensation domain-containing protein [Nonomuraea sp. NPDC050536]|uniref:condensation domain-containing protein n=1 Tax=Nonomuraea sp. NPDC050536 TaxID=3364366 RepID=UPI0037C7BB26
MVLASQAQHGMWITEVMHGTGYHMPFALWFDGPLDDRAMAAACEAVLARHPILGSAFEERDGDLHIVPAPAPPAVEVRSTLVAEELARPFDLARGPLARFTLTAVSPTRHVLLFVAHHLVFDGVSKDVLVADLARAYAGATLTPRPMPYGQAVPIPPEAVDYWKEHWRESPTVVIAGRPVAPRSGSPETVDVALDLPDLAGLSRFEVFLAAVHALLHRYGNAEAAVAVAMSTRDERTRDDIGMFATELPFYSAPGRTLRELATELRAQVREVNAFRNVPVARAVGGIRPRTSLTPVSVSYRRRAPDPEFPGLAFRADWQLAGGTVRSVLNLLAVDSPDGFRLSIQHNPEVVDRATVERVAADLREVLAADPDQVPHAAVAVATEAPAVAQAGARDGVDPEVVEQVRQIWMEVLRLDELGLEEDLYDLGGHSLTITQIGARIRKRLGVEVPFDVFLDDPTVTGVAAAVSELRA